MCIKNKLLILLSIVTTVCTSSCQKWTDVTPSIEMRGELVFSNESTVFEALNGVYGRMTKMDGYGRNMTWGLVDVMGGVYNPLRLQAFEVEATNGRFNDIQTEGVIENIWNNTYFCLANVNNLISSMDKSDPTIFSGNNKNLIKGEALGLRAMLHFDILRLFGPTYNTLNWNSPILPYVKQYTSNVTPRISGQAFVDLVLADLAEAGDLLKNDPIISAIAKEELQSRQVRLNYYAVKALQARVYLWIGNKEKAMQAATDVINIAAVKFPWIKAEEIISQGTLYDYIFSKENIFSLHINQQRENIEGLLVNIPIKTSLPQDFEPHYSITQEMRQDIYETSGNGITDYRNTFMIGSETFQSQTILLYKKLHQTGGLSTSGTQRPFTYAESRTPIVKLSEMFYIMAECLLDTDPVAALGYLNTVRSNRGITTLLEASLPVQQIKQEITKEYRKEFPCEGQYFYYLKRIGERNYILPLPKRELEYGL